MKHIEVWVHFIHASDTHRRVDLRNVDIVINIPNSLTKPLQSTHFQTLLGLMGLRVELPKMTLYSPIYHSVLLTIVHTLIYKGPDPSIGHNSPFAEEFVGVKALHPIGL
jgi:hypothetical protein